VYQGLPVKVPVDGGGRPRVLIVEDNPLISMDLEDILGSFGCEIVGPLATVQEALLVIEKNRIDFAVVDYVLEDGNAAPLAKILIDKAIPFAICTGSAGDEISSVFPNTPILGKPYNPEDVSLVVNSLIASRLAGT
jgi:DNA-binding NarL/FixJ family response regulator